MNVHLPTVKMADQGSDKPADAGMGVAPEVKNAKKVKEHPPPKAKVRGVRFLCT